MAFLIHISINMLCGVIVMIAHELPKTIAAHFLTHPLHKRKQIHFVKASKYIDPIGLLLFTVSSNFQLIAVGWQKPYEYNPNKLINKHRSLMPIMLSGQLTSLAFMVALIPIWRMTYALGVNEYIIYFIAKLVSFNFMIFFGEFTTCTATGYG